MTLLDYIDIAVKVILLIIGLYLAFFKSYLSKKGENLATKEDISEITKKIEDVKKEVYLKREYEVEWSRDRKKMLLNYCEKLLSLNEDLSKLRSRLFESGNNPEGHKKLMVYNTNRFDDFKLSHWQLKFYEPGSDLENLSEDIMSLMTTLKNAANRHLRNLKQNYNKRKEIVSSNITRVRMMAKLEGVKVLNRRSLDSYLDVRETAIEEFEDYRIELIKLISKELKHIS